MARGDIGQNERSAGGQLRSNGVVSIQRISTTSGSISAVFSAAGRERRPEWRQPARAEPGLAGG